MSVSQSLIKFRIKINILFIRFIGWAQSGNIRKNKDKGELLKGEILTNYYARKYLPSINNFTQQGQITVENPETIWQFWENPEGQSTPKIVKTSLESVRKFKGDFHHRILEKSTMGNYSDLPGHVIDKFNKKQIGYAHFADLLRLNLLKNHGGVWIDATAYMTNFIPQYIVNEDFFVFLTGEKTGFPYSFMQNCFIRSKKGSLLCEAWYKMCVEFWKNETQTLDYFQHQLMFKALILKHGTAKDLFNKMPHKPEDETHQLAGDNLLGKFDEKEWEKIKKLSFFQKTTFKINGAAEHPDTYFSKLCEGNL